MPISMILKENLSTYRSNPSMSKVSAKSLTSHCLVLKTASPNSFEPAGSSPTDQVTELYDIVGLLVCIVNV